MTATTLSLKIPKDLKSRLEDEARRRGKSKSLLVREALEASLSQKQKKRPLSVYDQIHDLIPKTGSGIGDLATNPKHMEGFGK